MDENAVDNLEFHQATVASDSNSPLHLIREKEMEISGRMLAAKRQADELVADARKKAAAIAGEAHGEASELAKLQEEQIQLEVEREIAEVASRSDEEAAALQQTIAARRDEAVRFVLDTLTG